MNRVLGGMYDGTEYMQAMREAKQEFDAWEQNKRKTFRNTKAKYHAVRLEKLRILRAG